MIINLNLPTKYYIVCRKTDMQKDIDTLASYIQTEFDMNPFNQSFFFFCGNSQNHFKLLYWYGDGFWLMYKRFEIGKLNWPRKEYIIREMSSEQVEWLKKQSDLSWALVEVWLLEEYPDIKVNSSTVQFYIKNLRNQHAIPKRKKVRQYETVPEVEMGAQIQVNWGQTKQETRG